MEGHIPNSAYINRKYLTWSIAETYRLAIKKSGIMIWWSKKNHWNIGNWGNIYKVQHSVLIRKKGVGKWRRRREAFKKSEIFLQKSWESRAGDEYLKSEANMTLGNQVRAVFPSTRESSPQVPIPIFFVFLESNLQVLVKVKKQEHGKGHKYIIARVVNSSVC